MAKKRADILLYEKGLTSSREKAKRIIMEGTVFIGDMRIDKPGEKYSEDVDIYIKTNPLKYVSRGGYKLEKAIEKFNLNLSGNIAMDIGASTGGFTDCMLKNGVEKVYAIDVGYGQLDWNLRNDDRVIVMERTNIRHVTKEKINNEIDFISIDVSFISLRLVLPVAQHLLKENGEIVALIKPQFETSPDKVGKNGIIRNKDVHLEVLRNIINYINSLNLGVLNLSFSPITGAKGNIEFLIHLKNNIRDRFSDDIITDIVNKAHSTFK
ncbi:MAG TPA: TlyA family RNA methyltransferase [Tissierellaceae bacterium]|nr:TlyA family RNA methyltransferase [Tissierellaceae bacterium]